MYIERILYPVETLGPGKRIVVWTRGCTKGCKNCANPELWTVKNKKNMNVGDLIQIILNICKDNDVEGITFTGGDPLEQADELLQLLCAIKTSIDDILVYTGYTYDNLQFIHSKEFMEKFEKVTSVLIDGPYRDELNDDKVVLRGSTNQNIIYFDKKIVKLYEEYLQKGRKIQNWIMGDKFISVGIHNRKRV